MVFTFINRDLTPVELNAIPMRHLQILNTDRHSKDFEVTTDVTQAAKLLVYNSIGYFLDKVRGSGRGLSNIHIRATNLPLIILYFYRLIHVDGQVYPFSRAVRVAEDYYQRIRKLVTNETSPDFNLMTTDECGNPYTFVTKIDEYQQTFRVGFMTVLEINRWIRQVDNAFNICDRNEHYNTIFINTINATPSRAPVCAEVNELRYIQFYEDVYCRWRNVAFNCKNLLPSGNELRSDTMMALYYTSMDDAKRTALPCLLKQQRLNGF